MASENFSDCLSQGRRDVSSLFLSVKLVEDASNSQQQQILHVSPAWLVAAPVVWECPFPDHIHNQGHAGSPAQPSRALHESQMVMGSCSQKSSTPSSAAGPATGPALPKASHRTNTTSQQHGGITGDLFSQGSFAFPALTSTAVEVLPGDEPAAWPLLHGGSRGSLSARRRCCCSSHCRLGLEGALQPTGFHTNSHMVIYI